MLTRRDGILLTCGILVGGGAMKVLYPTPPTLEVTHELKAVQVQRDTTKEAAKVTVVEKVFVPGPPGTKDCEVASERTTVTEAPKEQTVSSKQTLKEVDVVKQSIRPAYRLGLSCPITGCVGIDKFSITGSARIGESNFHIRTTLGTELMKTAIGLEYEF